MWTGRSTRLALALLLFAPSLVAQERPPEPFPLSLADALRLARATSEELVIADAGLLRARGEERRARSDYYPQISGAAGYTRTFASEFSGLGAGDGEAAFDTTGAAAGCPPFMPHPTLPLPARVDSLDTAVQCLTTTGPAPPDLGELFGGDLGGFGSEHRYDLTLSLSQTLYTGGRISAQNRAADAGRRIADIELRSTRAQVALDVATAYFDAALADQLFRIAQRTVAQAEQTLSVTQVAVTAGQQAEFDALRARVSRDNERAVAIQRRAERNIAFARLNTLLDLPQGTPVVLTTALSDEVPAPIVELAARTPAPDTAVDVRAPVQQAAEQVQIGDASLRIARAQRLPDITLSSQVGQVAFPLSATPELSEFRSTFFVALSAELPIFTGGRIRGDEQVAEADLREARAQLEQVRELAALDVRTSLEQLEAARAAWQASTGTVEEAERAYEIAELRYREGVASLLELTDTRVMLEQARANRAAAARDLQVAQTRLALLPDLPLRATTQAATRTATIPAAGTTAPATSLPGAAPGRTRSTQPVAPTTPTTQGAPSSSTGRSR